MSRPPNTNEIEDSFVNAPDQVGISLRELILAENLLLFAVVQELELPSHVNTGHQQKENKEEQDSDNDVIEIRNVVEAPSIIFQSTAMY